jgi:serine/threonine protein kinase
MSKMQGNSNIVNYQAHTVKKHNDGFGWDIYIQMELLTSLTKYNADNSLTREQIIKLGIDMCQALNQCKKNNIIHRDIKPDNIFVSDVGDFKLGDFGIATIQKNCNSERSRKGTFSYMAPEIFWGKGYDLRADIYSLGIE